MLVKSWIFEDNLRPFLQTLAWLVRYPFEEEDWLAIDYGIDDPDDEQKRSTNYEIPGEQVAKIWIERDPPTIKIEAEVPDELSFAVETAGSAFSTFRVI